MSSSCMFFSFFKGFNLFLIFFVYSFLDFFKTLFIYSFRTSVVFIAVKVIFLWLICIAVFRAGISWRGGSWGSLGVLWENVSGPYFVQKAHMDQPNQLDNGEVKRKSQFWEIPILNNENYFRSYQNLDSPPIAILFVTCHQYMDHLRWTLVYAVQNIVQSRMLKKHLVISFLSCPFHLVLW